MTLTEIKALARRHNCYVVTKGADYLLYRSSEPRGVFIGKATSINKLATLTKKACFST